MAHAEASARTVDAAVTAAAAQLGLRSDQVDVEVLEDPVPSTFGYIGTPARVRVTPRSAPTAPPTADVTASPNSGVTPPGPAVPGSAETTGRALEGTIAPSPQDVSETTNVPNGAAPTSAPPPEAEPSGVGPSVAATSAGATSGAELSGGSPVAAAMPADATAGATGAGTAEAPTQTAASGGDKSQDASSAAAPAEGATGGATRGSRRTSRQSDEPIAPEMVEEDTERAGDFLEGLLDALDVDGDITTWVDEVGGHIDLEGADLEPLIGPNGETLDSLQELTRLAVLRRSKRRVRLLLDINGFRARQRDQLISIVRATAEQVIKTREDHELQPMSPAERKIVHDAVAAIDGVQTESLGEDPNRRVVIRPT